MKLAIIESNLVRNVYVKKDSFRKLVISKNAENVIILVSNVWEALRLINVFPAGINQFIIENL
jgi:hypothetical protein